MWLNILILCTKDSALYKQKQWKYRNKNNIAQYKKQGTEKWVVYKEGSTYYINEVTSDILMLRGNKNKKINQMPSSHHANKLS